jgi:hypothetical protein
MAASPRSPFALLALAIAALLSSWNPASAVLALAVGLVDALLCLVARREAGGLRPPLKAALALSVAAVVVSGAVLVRTAWAGHAGEGSPIVAPMPAAERKAALERGAEATRGAREAARRELDALPSRK